MDSDGLPLVGPGIDYTKVEAINQKRTIAFINHFVTHTARFLNHFSCVCEDKLEHLSGRLQQLEISLSIVEAKLSSIPGLESVTAPQSSASSAPATDASPAAAAAAPSGPPAPPSDSGPPPPPAAEAAPAPPVEEAPPQNTVSQDPRYMPFFKMLRVGVVAQAVKGKMVLAGLDPELLDTPDAPAPSGAPAPQEEAKDSDSDSADDFSDSD
ncbi:WASH complex subunit 3 [Aplysia californica]|uniref:WASH complex subunit 3 n=1 Tax=Aplysia californica TaxID=6500 RepID=A0ABM0K421_APLCA|nr:WASH complex subunit 3 [Aplysia californica]